MEPIIQLFVKCIFWLGKHINKNNTRLIDLAKDNGIFILNQENQRNVNYPQVTFFSSLNRFLD